MCIGLLLGNAQAATRKKPAHRAAKTATSRHAHGTRAKGKLGKSVRKSPRKRGQQAINSERVRDIQAALIREKYLDGQPNGVWDQRSKDAMARYQLDHGWQSKVVPDSRALIKLGLGPDRAGLINPETAAMGLIPGGGTAHNPPPNP
jgi:peptidoglycan hydrolase-like protein with peptidoglycan-binding domain